MRYYSKRRGRGKRRKSFTKRKKFYHIARGGIRM